MTKNLQLAVSKLHEAVKLYEKGLYDKANVLKEAADKIFDTIDFQRAKDEILYTESINFGIINHVALHNMKPEVNKSGLSINESTAKSVKTYVDRIKKNKNLRAQYNIYERLSKCEDTENFCTYSDMVMSKYANDIEPETIEDDNYELLGQMRELDYDECVDIEPETIDLYSLISDMIMSYNDPDKFSEYIDKRNKAKEQLENIKVKNWDDVRIDDSLTEDEVDFVYQLSNMGLEELQDEFEAEKQKTLSIIMDKLTSTEDVNEVLMWKEAYKKAHQKMFSEETALEDIAKFKEISSL